MTNRLLYIPNSHKVYVEGSRPDLQVPMREIQLTPTEAAKGMKGDRSIRVLTPVWELLRQRGRSAISSGMEDKSTQYNIRGCQLYSKKQLGQ